MARCIGLISALRTRRSRRSPASHAKTRARTAFVSAKAASAGRPPPNRRPLAIHSSCLCLTQRLRSVGAYVFSGTDKRCSVQANRRRRLARRRGWAAVPVWPWLSGRAGGGGGGARGYWAPRTRKRHQQEHRPQRPTERSDPTQHAKGRTGDCPGPRKETTTRRNVTGGGGGGARGHGGRGGGGGLRP